LRKNRREKTL
jgi:hypothetical protein